VKDGHLLRRKLRSGVEPIGAATAEQESSDEQCATGDE
jgi:hypothetical protein